MYRNNVKNILSQVKISKNNEVNDFMKSFVYHNEKFFEKCLRLKMGNFRKLPFSIGIHYECGPDKWGSVGMMNQMIKRGHIEIVKDHRNNCYCLDATVKLVNRILNNCYRTMENFKCISEGRYNDRKLNPCR
jgi:hypothetical protein|tara:strand:- start:377 stop:772 length:396 start_codon:yes stop_codon:yes gene_type:complete